MKRISVSLPEESHRALRVAAAKRDKSMGEIARLLIVNWLGKEGESERVQREPRGA